MKNRGNRTGGLKQKELYGVAGGIIVLEWLFLSVNRVPTVYQYSPGFWASFYLVFFVGAHIFFLMEGEGEERDDTISILDDGEGLVGLIYLFEFAKYVKPEWTAVYEQWEAIIFHVAMPILLVATMQLLLHHYLSKKKKLNVA